MNNTNELEQVDIKRIIEIVLERFVSIVVITILCGIISFGVSRYFLTPKYESYITMYVNNRRSTETEVNETKMLTSDIQASQQLVPTYVEMIKSNNVLEVVADKFNERTGESYSVDKIKRMIEATSLGSTEILKVTVKTTEAAEAREIANIIAEIAPQKIQTFIDRSDVKIIDYAKISTTPVSPNMRNNTIIGTLLGLVLSISFILIKELFDVRVKNTDDLVKRFNYPVLGTIPEIIVSYDDSAYDLAVESEFENEEDNAQNAY
ncbi:MAG: hypothetical protein IKA17_09175 [Clostridia bacterium]|nr:hypothetical protein [Clostridia bacterium]